MGYIMLFEQWLALESQPLLLEGGAYGHLSHPFEDLNLTMRDVQDMIDSTIKGAFGPENFVQEKVDGQNIMISWKDGRLIAARNKSHLRNAGENALTAQGMADLFKGRGDIEIAYNTAMTDLAASIGALSEADKLRLFDNGKKFASVEVITPVTQNTIPYGQNILVFHGLVEYDESANVIGEDKNAAREIGKLIADANAASQDTFFVRGPVDISIMPFPNTKKRAAYYNAQLKTIMKDSNTNLNSTILDYVMGSAIKVLKEEAKKAKVNIPESAIEGLARRIGGVDKSYTVPTIKNELDPEAAVWYMNLEKTQYKSLKRLIYAPLEGIFLEIGTEMMKNISAFLSANPTAASAHMKKEVEDTINKIKTDGDATDVEKLEAELLRLSAAGGIESIVPTEGITFVYKGKAYKYTGIFAPLHQIRSILAYK